jgi:hypothetical protein
MTLPSFIKRQAAKSKGSPEGLNDVEFLWVTMSVFVAFGDVLLPLLFKGSALNGTSLATLVVVVNWIPICSDWVSSMIGASNNSGKSIDMVSLACKPIKMTTASISDAFSRMNAEISLMMVGESMSQKSNCQRIGGLL